MVLLGMKTDNNKLFCHEAEDISSRRLREIDNSYNLQDRRERGREGGTDLGLSYCPPHLIRETWPGIVNLVSAQATASEGECKQFL